VPNFSLFFLNYAAILIGIAMIVMGFLQPDPNLTPMTVGTGIMVILLGLWTYKSEGRMPLTLYRNGYAKPRVPLKHVIKRKEVFVPWKSIKNITLKIGAGMHGMMWFLYHDGRKELYWGKYIDDPLRFMRVLYLFVPGKMNDTFRYYVGPPNQRKIIPDMLPKWPIPKICMIRFLISLMFILAIPTTIGITAIQGTFRSSHLLFLLCCVGGGFAFFHNSLFWDCNAQFALILKRARAEPDGIHFNVTYLGKSFKEIVSPIPWRAVEKVELSVNSRWYWHQSKVTTYSGEIFYTPARIFEYMDTVKSFRKMGTIYINQTESHLNIRIDPKGTMDRFTDRARYVY